MVMEAFVPGDVIKNSMGTKFKVLSLESYSQTNNSLVLHYLCKHLDTDEIIKLQLDSKVNNVKYFTKLKWFRVILDDKTMHEGYFLDFEDCQKHFRKNGGHEIIESVESENMMN